MHSLDRKAYPAPHHENEDANRLEPDLLTPQGIDSDLQSRIRYLEDYNNELENIHDQLRR